MSYHDRHARISSDQVEGAIFDLLSNERYITYFDFSSVSVCMTLTWYWKYDSKLYTRLGIVSPKYPGLINDADNLCIHLCRIEMGIVIIIDIIL